MIVSNPLDAMCHVAKSVSGLPRERVLGMAGHPRHGAVLDLHRLGDRLVGEGRPDPRPRRPRRPDGPARERDPGRRRPAALARLRRADRGDDRAHGEGRRRARRAARNVCLVCAGRRGRADRRRDHARREARPSVRGACSKASTASTGSTSVCRCRLGAGGIEAIVELELDEDEQAALDASAAAVREVVGVLAGGAADAADRALAHRPSTVIVVSATLPRRRSSRRRRRSCSAACCSAASSRSS